MRKKRLLAIVLSALMMITFVPTYAFAESGNTAGYNYAGGETYDLTIDKSALQRDAGGVYQCNCPFDGFNYYVMNCVSEDESICQVDYYYGGITIYPKSAGSTTVVVYGIEDPDSGNLQEGYETTFNVTITQEAVDLIRYYGFLKSTVQFDVYLTDEAFEGCVYPASYEEYDSTFDWLNLSKEEVLDKLTIKATFDGETKACTIKPNPYDDEEYLIKLPAGWNKKIAWKDTVTITSSMGKASVKTTIKRLKDADYFNDTISKTTWTGKSKKPTVKLINEETNKPFVKGTDYVCAYDTNKNVGYGNVYVYSPKKSDYFFEFNYSFQIVPKGTTLKTPVKAEKAITVKWNKQATKMSKSRITGYQIQLATNSKFTKNKKLVTVKGYSNTSKKITKLKAKKKYYVRIRTYKIVYGEKFVSSWSKYKTVTTK